MKLRIAEFAARFALALGVLLGAAFCLRWLVIPALGMPWRLHDPVALLAAMPLAWLAWRQSGALVARTALMSALYGAVSCGSIAALLGVVASVVFEANQGPLLALFVLAPVGAAAGAVAGVLWWRSHPNGPQEPQRD